MNTLRVISSKAMVQMVGSTLCLLLSIGLFGQQNSTLHIIYNINDHQQDGIFIGCQKDRSSAKEVFGVVGEVAKQPGSGFSLAEHPVAFDKASVQALLNSMSLAANDAVIFLYSGHGLKDDGNNRWPMLYYCPEAEVGQPNSTGCELSLKWVHEQLKAKDIRMSIALGSSCNNDPSGEANVEQLRRELAEHGSNSQPEGVAHYNFDLITKFEGHILASASSPGQVAFLNDAIGSYYVAAFLNVLVDGLIAEQPTTWASIFKQTKKTVKHVMKKNQDPQFLIVKNDRYMYSGPQGGSYADDLAKFEAIDASEFSAAWEAEFMQEEALEMIPYLLVQGVIERAAQLGGDGIERETDALVNFYDREILAPYYYGYSSDSGLAKYFLEATIDDFEDEYFKEELAYAEELFLLLDANIQEKVLDRIDRIGR